MTIPRPNRLPQGFRAGSAYLGRVLSLGLPPMNNRWRDQKPPKSGKIRQKRADTLNENLSVPIPEFSPKARGTESNATCEKYHFFDPHRPYQHNLPVREHCAERCWPVKPQPASSTAIASRPDQLVPRRYVVGRSSREKVKAVKSQVFARFWRWSEIHFRQAWIASNVRLS